MSYLTIFLTTVLPMKRHHVHLSPDFKTAKIVAIRHKKETPYILTIDSERMNKNDLIFYLSDNGVWLIDAIPSKYIKDKSFMDVKQN